MTVKETNFVELFVIIVWNEECLIVESINQRIILRCFYVLFQIFEPFGYAQGAKNPVAEQSRSADFQEKDVNFFTLSWGGFC